MAIVAPSGVDRKGELADAIEVVRELLIEILMEGGAYKDQMVRGIQFLPSHKQDAELYRWVCSAMRDCNKAMEPYDLLEESEIQAIQAIAKTQLVNSAYMVEITAWDLYQSRLKLRQAQQRNPGLSERDEQVYQLRHHGLSIAAANNLLDYDRARIGDCLNAVAWVRFVTSFVAYDSKRGLARKRAAIKSILSPEALQKTSTSDLRRVLNLYAPLPSRYQDDRGVRWFAGLLSIVAHSRPMPRPS